MHKSVFTSSYLPETLAQYAFITDFSLVVENGVVKKKKSVDVESGSSTQTTPTQYAFSTVLEEDTTAHVRTSKRICSDFLGVAHEKCLPTMCWHWNGFHPPPTHLPPYNYTHVDVVLVMKDKQLQNFSLLLLTVLGSTSSALNNLQEFR